MGLVSRAVHSGGGHVLGIVPKAVLPRELIGDTPGELKDVSGMHQRKAEMARDSDAFIALPGKQAAGRARARDRCLKRNNQHEHERMSMAGCVQAGTGRWTSSWR